MRVWPKNRFVHGTYKRECDVCSFDYLRSQLLVRWDKKIVCPECFEVKDPQLEVRVHKERHIKID
jgi:hypothetical protein